ncbi:putative transcription factor bHLH086 [Dendrobium catenatum]|uniref:putative transcription factor bHLH086 n=1 Tax=Dendrobium catenatum TaxID=906689 RepID=UPI0010A0319C|nr:putative transcription factor bHLH086 [Dendrobium catenatum]
MALARERAIYGPQSTFIQGLDPSSLAHSTFRDHHGFLHDEIFSNPNTFMFEASNFPLQEAHPLINFKASADHQLMTYSTSTVLSFERNLDYGENSMSWIDHAMEDESPINHLSSKSFDTNSFKYEQESIGKEKGLNKRAFMDCDMEASKKHGGNAKRQVKAKLSSSKDTQSIAAKVDLVTMLEKAVSYVKFLQLQVKVLATDEFWPAQGGKAPEVSQVKEAIDAILSSHRERNFSSN